MAEFYLKYNPYKIESTMKYNQKDIVSDSQLYAFKNERLQLWVEKLFDILFEELNTQNINVIFEGTELDFNDVDECARKICEKNPNLGINLEYIPVKKNEDLIDELKELFEDLQNGPFETLRDPKLKEGFEKALGSEFEVNVIATMSSGKSTLINSFLGQELMPAKNEACTATIGRIKAVPNQEVFTGTCYDKNQNQLCDVIEVDSDTLKEFNENEKVSEIHLEGEIPFSNSSKTNLILIDTPGPNNSRDRSHQEKTFSIIKDKSAKNLVLYVLNATQLGTNDDQYLLKTVAGAMQVGGKQSKDRFMFVINKIDTYDVENGDSVISALDNVRQYLKKECGIENPNIFPASAEFAKVIRLSQQNQQLTRNQNRTLNSIDLLNEENELHLEKYAPIQESRRREFMKQIEEYQRRQDVKSEALIHTGIPAIEAAINDYLEKYAFSSKISTTVGTFKQEIDKIMLKEDLKNRIEGNIEEKERLEKAINKISEQIKDSKLALSFKAKINSLSVDVQEHEITKLESKIDATLRHLLKKASPKMRMNEVQRLTSEASKLTNNVQADVVTELDSIVNEYLMNQAQNLLSEYTKTVMNVFEEDILFIDDVNLQMSQFVLGDLPDARSLIEDFIFEDEVVIGQRQVRNESKKWYKPFTWFKPKYYKENITEIQEFVDGIELVETFIEETLTSVTQTTNMAKENMMIQAEALKEMFINKIDELERLIQQKVNELQEMMTHSTQLESEIQEQRQQYDWLYEINQRLEKILEL